MSTAEGEVIPEPNAIGDRRATAVVTVRMSRALHERLRDASRRMSVALGADYSMNRLCLEAIVAWLCELEREAVPSPNPES